MFFRTRKGGVAHTHSPTGECRADYILKKHRDGWLVRNVTMYFDAIIRESWEYITISVPRFDP